MTPAYLLLSADRTLLRPLPVGMRAIAHFKSATARMVSLWIVPKTS
ncbi:hypothetical protein QUA81_06605 [Microcoleus sp. F6_B4]